MKTSRIFVAHSMSALLGAIALGWLLIMPIESHAYDHPTPLTKEIGPYMGDPEEPGGTIEFNPGTENSPYQGQLDQSEQPWDWRALPSIWRVFIFHFFSMAARGR